MQGRLWSEANADVSELVLVISIRWTGDGFHPGLECVKNFL